MDYERIIAIADIHGCSDALEAILKAIKPAKNDLIVTLGDYIDRGPNSKKVIEILLDLPNSCHHVAIKGNHEEMYYYALYGGKSELSFFLKFGGYETLMSYGSLNPKDVPYDHRAFLNNTLPYFETDKYIFTHANYDPTKDFSEQTGDTIRWKHLDSPYPEPHISGKTVIVGHSIQEKNKILDLGHLKCIDTGCGVKPTGKLTALDLTNNKIYQKKQGA